MQKISIDINNSSYMVKITNNSNNNGDKDIMRIFWHMKKIACGQDVTINFLPIFSGAFHN